MKTEPSILPTPPDNPLDAHLREAMAQAGGWIGFDRFMALALYTPGWGYYSNSQAKFGHLPQSGSDFVTAPELTPLFGQALAAQVAQALQVTGTQEVWEFGAGSGALAAQLLRGLAALGVVPQRYTIVDLSGTLRARQQARLAPWGDQVTWVDALPEQLSGVVVGNEVLDAMPVQLLVRQGGRWFERGVVWHAGRYTWADQATDLRPPCEIEGAHDYLTEVHPQAEAFVGTLIERLTHGAAFFLDYGFTEHEYYHPQRHMGTVMCHQAHQSDANPLVDVGRKDITAHVNFTGIALAAQNAAEARGREAGVLGYASQARFLLNCGLPALMEHANLADRSHALKLIHEHEMGELFKVMGLYVGAPWDALGFATGDRSHTL